MLTTHGADTSAKVKEFFKGETTWTVESFYKNANLSDLERQNVKEKFMDPHIQH